MTSRQIIDMILDDFRKEGIEVCDVEYGNGYFLFEFGEDTVCHFRLKKNKGFRIGIWTSKYDHDGPNVVAHLFGQYERNIDKFKPSRSFYHEVIEKFTDAEEFTADDLLLYDAEDMLREIEKHRFIAFYRDMYDAKWNFSGPKAFWTWIKFNVKQFVRFIWKWILYGCQISDISAVILWYKFWNPEILKFRFVDFEKRNSGWSTSRRWIPEILVKDDCDEGVLEKIEKYWWDNIRRFENIDDPTFYTEEFPPISLDDWPDSEPAEKSTESTEIIEDTGCGEQQ